MVHIFLHAGNMAAPDMQAVLASMAFLAEPRIRSVLNQLGCLTEVVYGKHEVHNTGFFEVSSPLGILLGHPQRRAALQELGHQYPALGSSAEIIASNFKGIRAERNREQHLDKPEDVLQEVHQLRGQIFMSALQHSSPFQHAALMGADAFAAKFLAAPRLLKLAAMALMYCQDSLDHMVGVKWTWAQPRPRKRVAVEQWVASVIQAVPQLGSSTAVFAKSADQVQADAAEFGPTKLFYLTDELQLCVARCISVGLFNAALQEELPFAYSIVMNLDTLIDGAPVRCSRIAVA